MFSPKSDRRTNRQKVFFILSVSISFYEVVKDSSNGKSIKKQNNKTPKDMAERAIRYVVREGVSDPLVRYVDL